MNDVASNYYVKIRGRTLGPLTPDRVRQMVQQGQLSRVNLISTDGQEWLKAGDIPALFEAAGSQGRFQGVAAPQETGNTATQTAEVTQQAKADWHYAIGSQQLGPVTFGQIRGMVANGTLAAGELVWKEGMKDWEPVSAIPELAASLPPREEPARRRERRPRRDRDEVERQPAIDLGPTQAIVRSGTGWAFFITIASYVFAGLTFFISIAGLVVGSRSQQGVVIAQAVINMLFGGVIVTMAIFLNRHASYAARFCATSDPADLNQSLGWLSRLWLLIGICLIFILALTLIAIIYGMAIGADLSRYSPY